MDWFNIMFKQDNLGFNLTSTQLKKLEKYVELLKKWNKAYNLVGKSTLDNIYERHVLDAVQLVKYIDKDVKKILDFGSGAGIPAVMLAIILDNTKVFACERINKKCQFLNQVRRELSLDNLIVINQDVQEIAEEFDLITCRAVAEISDILNLTQNISAKNYLLPKGKNYLFEIEKAKDFGYSFDYNISTSLVDSESVILRINRILKNS